MKNILSGIKDTFAQIFNPDNLSWIINEFSQFLNFLNVYTKDKIFFFSGNFEEGKGALIRNVLIKRGKRNRMFLHVSAMTVLTVGVVVSPFVSDTNLFGENANLSFTQNEAEAQSITSVDVFDTTASEKPRSEIISYTVQNGDTISNIAQRFGISEDTIKWQNSLSGDRITPGDTLEILPVSGIAHKVGRGDTVYTVAEKYDAFAQAIVDFPFNDFANPQTFSLVEGQILIVPEGVPPRAAPSAPRQTRYLATAPQGAVTGGGFSWPISGTLNQGYAWYHPGLDLGAPIGTPIVAATSGTVSAVYTSGWHGGYGIHVIISGSNGYTTLYAHMSGVNVSPGQTVSAGGTTVGWIGMTGRTTGPHLHFEVRGPAGNINPLGVLN